jgi:hypothetical protein
LIEKGNQKKEKKEKPQKKKKVKTKKERKKKKSMKPSQRQDISISQVSCGANEPNGWQVNSGLSSIIVCPNRPPQQARLQQANLQQSNLQQTNSQQVNLQQKTIFPPEKKVDGIMPAINWKGLPDFKFPWRQIKYNIPSMPSNAPVYKTPYDYSGEKLMSMMNEAKSNLSTMYKSAYDKIKNLLSQWTQSMRYNKTIAGASENGLENKHYQIIWDKMATCLRLNGVDDLNLSKINKWYSEVISTMMSDIKSGSTTMCETGFQKSISTLGNDIGEKWMTMQMDQKILGCLLSAVVSSHQPMLQQPIPSPNTRSN